MSLSQSNTPGEQKLLTWRLAWPAPRSSTGTSSAGPYRGTSRRVQRALGVANAPPSRLVTGTGGARGGELKAPARGETLPPPVGSKKGSPQGTGAGPERGRTGGLSRPGAP